MSRDDAIVLDILSAARLTIEFLGDLDKDTFLRDRKTQSAVLHQLLLVGEARQSSVIRRLSEREPRYSVETGRRHARCVDSSIRRC